MTTTIRQAVDAVMADTVALRRRLHQHPEIGNDLPYTRAIVLEALAGLPLEITLHQSTSGIAALLDGGHPGPTLLLRGDMDALPVHEHASHDYVSTISGQMHACGHDTHAAMLVGAARVLAERRDELAGRVLFMFQPGEEGYHGAKLMIDEGLLDVPPLADGTPSPVAAAFALHTFATLPTGMVVARSGPASAAADEFAITVTGAGGHGSRPFRAVDPVPVAAEIILALHTMTTRRTDPFDPTVLSVCRITAGDATNVIPDRVVLEGTLRTRSVTNRAAMHEHIANVATHVAKAHGAAASTQIAIGYPAVYNDPELTQFALDVAQDLFGSERAVMRPAFTMGAEDFAYVAERVPATMFLLGATHPSVDPESAAFNHSPAVEFDENALPIGVELLVEVARRYLAPGRAER